MARKKQTRRPKKHKPVPVKFTINNFEEYQKFTQDDTAKAFIYLHLVNAVKISINSEPESIELFNLIDFNSIICLKREDWKDSLSNALIFFSDKELYEKAAECKRLISLI